MATYNSPQEVLDYLASQVPGVGGGAAARTQYLMADATVLVNGIGASISGEQVTIPGSDTTGGSAVDPDDPNVLILEWEIKDPAGTTFSRFMDETAGYMGDFLASFDIAEAVVPSGTDLSVFTYMRGKGTNNAGTRAIGSGMLFGSNVDPDLVDAHRVSWTSGSWASGVREKLAMDRTVGDLALMTSFGLSINRRNTGTRERPRFTAFVQSTGFLVDSGTEFIPGFELTDQLEFNDDAAAPTVPRLQMAFFRRDGDTGNVIVAPTLSSYLQEHL